MKDPYVSKNNVLKNKLKIDDYDKLNQAEADIGFSKLINIDSLEINNFDVKLLKRIHKHIFEDIFEWAGEFRTVPIIKEEIVLPGYSIPYSDVKNIDRDLRKNLNEINCISWQNMSKDEISMLFARKISLLWRVHPFRDGNTRTMLCFAYMYAKEHSFEFDMTAFTNNLSRSYDENGSITNYNIRDKFALACLDEDNYPEVEHLARVFSESIIDKRNLHM